MILDIDTSLGYPEIGALLSGVLFGILTMQVYIYHRNFPNDSGWIKFGLVDSMWLFELAHTICEFYGLYYVTVFRYGDPTVFLAFPHELAAVPVFDGLIITIVQGFFTHRIAKFAGPPYTVPIVCCILMVFQMVASIGLSAAVIAEQSTYHFLDQWTCPCIQSDQKPEHYHLPQCLTLKLCSETGVVTSSVSIIVMICFLINPTNFLWVTFYAVLPKFSSNAMLAKYEPHHLSYFLDLMKFTAISLNSRMRLRDMQVTTVTELVTIPFNVIILIFLGYKLPGTTAQSLEVQTNLPETSGVPRESIMEEGHQSEIKTLPVTQD
ncbi:hypothetical protein F5879DRAFT_1020850 [Lentinula edodes]|nr:hypothetical protein F5879DRAFT_1020850 [Lentinula edodes]KAJ3914517.1 hypothetical protein F5877DRAFT_70643 [Lentinula edodes]